MDSWLFRLAAFCHRRRLAVLSGWIVLAATMVLLAVGYGAGSDDDFNTDATQSDRHSG